MNLLETVDLMLLRGILKAPKSTTKKMLFLELGLVPFREIIRQRRLGLLFYILNQSKESMLYKVFESQRRNSTPKDWVTTILSDLNELNWDITIEDIQQMKKKRFLNIVKRKVQNKSFKDLLKIKEKHSKVKSIKHKMLQMQNYLLPNKLNMKIEDSQLIFKLRCKVTETKINLKGMYDDHGCIACSKENESQEHILQCNEILQLNNEYEINEIPKYEKLQNGDVSDQLLISKIFTSNMKVLEKLKNIKDQKG